VNISDDRPAVARRDDRDPAAAAALPIGLDDLADLLAAVLAAEGVPAEAEASLQLVGPDAIAELKAEHLGGTGPTDVLSFPLDGLDGAGPDWIVGDVVVCPEVAAAQAVEHAGDLASELDLLVVHGGLHLCGWDHATDDERDRMWARERELMAALGRTPTRDPWTPRAEEAS
jgi:probable rRNA maturation factor